MALNEVYANADSLMYRVRGGNGNVASGIPALAPGDFVHIGPVSNVDDNVSTGISGVVEAVKTVDFINYPTLRHVGVFEFSIDGGGAVAGQPVFLVDPIDASGAGEEAYYGNLVTSAQPALGEANFLVGYAIKQSANDKVQVRINN